MLCDPLLRRSQGFLGLSWSEIGFFYFTGTWLALLFNGNFLITRAILAALTIIGLPYTFFSIYYQGLIAKKWCLLCCSVQAILWIEFFAQYPDFDFGAFSDIAHLVKVLLISAIPVPVWILLKPVIQAKQQLVPLKYQLNKMKYNNELFHLMLSNQPKYAQPKEKLVNNVRE